MPICFADIYIGYLQWSKKKGNTGKSQAINMLAIEFSTKNT